MDFEIGLQLFPNNFFIFSNLKITKGALRNGYKGESQHNIYQLIVCYIFLVANSRGLTSEITSKTSNPK